MPGSSAPACRRWRRTARSRSRCPSSGRRGRGTGRSGRCPARRPPIPRRARTPRSPRRAAPAPPGWWRGTWCARRRRHPTAVSLIVYRWYSSHVRRYTESPGFGDDAHGEQVAEEPQALVELRGQQLDVAEVGDIERGVVGHGEVLSGGRKRGGALACVGGGRRRRRRSCGRCGGRWTWRARCRRRPSSTRTRAGNVPLGCSIPSGPASDSVREVGADRAGNADAGGHRGGHQHADGGVHAGGDEGAGGDGAAACAAARAGTSSAPSRRRRRRGPSAGRPAAGCAPLRPSARPGLELGGALVARRRRTRRRAAAPPASRCRSASTRWPSISSTTRPVGSSRASGLPPSSSSIGRGGAGHAVDRGIAVVVDAAAGRRERRGREVAGVDQPDADRRARSPAASRVRARPRTARCRRAGCRRSARRSRSAGRRRPAGTGSRRRCPARPTATRSRPCS